MSPLTSTLVLVLASVGVGVGCTSPEPADLALPEDWQMLPAEQDPWPGRPQGVSCPARALVAEEGFAEIDTTDCPWLSAQAAARAPVRAGDTIDLFVFHTALVAEEPAQATIGVRFGDAPLWSVDVAIPSSDAYYDVSAESPVDLDVGDPLVWHVHNHGANSYRLASIRRE